MGLLSTLEVSASDGRRRRTSEHTRRGIVRSDKMEAVLQFYKPLLATTGQTLHRVSMCMRFRDNMSEKDVVHRLNEHWQVPSCRTGCQRELPKRPGFTCTVPIFFR